MYSNYVYQVDLTLYCMRNEKRFPSEEIWLIYFFTHNKGMASVFFRFHLFDWQLQNVQYIGRYASQLP